jgi:curved DNA-binding protein CbpA
VADDRFKTLTQAYDTLVRPDRRALHDRRAATSQVHSESPLARAADTPRDHSPPGSPARQVLRTPRRARTAAWVGFSVALVGLAGAVFLGTRPPSGDTGKTITLWIVAIKLLICGLALAATGTWRLRHFRRVGAI